MNKCNCDEDCTPCEMHGFCHLCVEENLRKQIDELKAEKEELFAAAEAK